jgi:hypothetical protein
MRRDLVPIATDPGGNMRLGQYLAAGSADEKPLLKSDRWKFPESWSPDGWSVLFTQVIHEGVILPADYSSVDPRAPL